MSLTRESRIVALMIYTLTVSAMRSFRPPSDYAQAFWLLDYRFGFVKRGLIGEIVTLVTGRLSIPITAELISGLAYSAFWIYCAAIIVLSIRIVRRSGWSAEAVLVSLVFLSSPFIVMSAHLVGYLDNVVIVLGIASVVFLLKGRPWLGAILQVLALLTHEFSILLVFPSFCLAWLLTSSRRQDPGVPLLPLTPVLLPIATFLLLAAGQEFFAGKDFAKLFTDHLSQFPFIQADRVTWVPLWVSTSFLDYFSLQSGEFLARISSGAMYGLVLPTALAILFFTLSAHRILAVSAESLVLLGVSFAPQLMHLVAWDTPRIWTYTILCAFLALWVYSEISARQKSSSASRLLCLVALSVNAVVSTPLMDLQTDNYSPVTRLLLYSPVLISGLVLILRWESIPVAERLRIQGSDILGSLSSARRHKATPRFVRGAGTGAPEHLR